jgi:ketosteroid isomerase-like protein
LVADHSLTHDMLDNAPDAVNRYFELDTQGDTEGIVALFTDDATLIDEGVTRRGVEAIRAWQNGPASEYDYTTTITRGERVGDNGYRVIGRLEGNFPGGTADLTWQFAIDGDRVSRLVIAP